MKTAQELLANLVKAYEREVNPAPDWTYTALTEDEFLEQTKEYRAAKEYLENQLNENTIRN